MDLYITALGGIILGVLSTIFVENLINEWKQGKTALAQHKALYAAYDRGYRAGRDNDRRYVDEMTAYAAQCHRAMKDMQGTPCDIVPAERTA